MLHVSSAQTQRCWHDLELNFAALKIPSVSQIHSEFLHIIHMFLIGQIFNSTENRNLMIWALFNSYLLGGYFL